MRSFTVRFVLSFCLLLSFVMATLAQSKAFDTSRMDTSADACEDFFQYANGNWVKNTQIPPAFSRWGTFNTLADNNQNVLHDILENAAKTKAAKGSDLQLIGDLYSSCMDEAAIEKADISPLKPRFAEIDKIANVKQLQTAIANFHKAGAGMFFSFGAGADAKNSNLTIANAGQGGLSLPNKDYYTKDDAKSKETRDKFVEYMTNMFKLAGDDADKAAANAQTVMKIQMRLANASKAPVELRDPDKRYNKMTVEDAQKLTPNFSWTDYMKTRGVPPIKDFNIGQPDFFKELDKILTETNLNDLKTYMRWMILNGSASRLSKRFGDENFNFFGKYLSGTKEQQPRWKRCAQTVDGTLGEALGQEYIKKAFTAEAKKRMNEMIDNLVAAFKVRINGLEWMSDETKKQALIKLAAIKRKIGSPDVLRGYKGLVIDRKSYFDNGQRAAQFQINRNLQDINKPVDKTRMGMTPPTVNASYSPSFNDITFPAGILQPPFFNFAADDAINYGAIVAVIGHEVSHGFDDSGSRYDADGNLKMWWTPEDRKKFEERANCVVEQFNGYEVQPGLHINGKLTLGENIGDLGGLTAAYTAFKKSMEGKPRPANIDGFTPEQRFFLGWAQVWAAKSTPEAERQQVLGDPHSHQRYRVNGPMSNLPQFAEAWGCKVGQKMVSPKPCQIW
ncbi:MAG: M13 family metallopeptidase [Pyrinomonadaceae bacterium]|nr:M13 family metallopeptidase [Pyrinomonadaceae bacterium]